MSLISQPGSDYQLTEITLDLGRAGGITHLLTDIHGLGPGAGPELAAPGRGRAAAVRRVRLCARRQVRRRRG
jgi:hypothetical protein